MQAYLLPELLSCWYAQDRVERFSTPWDLWRALDSYLATQESLALVLFKWSQNTIFLEEAIKYVLRYPEDGKKLCRQSTWWLEKKHK
jgi:hypothetical protein